LGEVAHVTQVSNGGGYLQAALNSDGGGYECQRSGSRFGLFDLKAFVAASA
jgi:phage-related protein